MSSQNIKISVSAASDLFAAYLLLAVTFINLDLMCLTVICLRRGSTPHVTGAVRDEATGERERATLTIIWNQI